MFERPRNEAEKTEAKVPQPDGSHMDEEQSQALREVLAAIRSTH